MGGSSAPGSAERKSRRDQRKAKRGQRRSKNETQNQEATPPSTPTTPTPAPSPIIEEPADAEAGDTDLHTWMKTRGFAAHTESLMTIGVETVDDLSLVTYDDLTDLKIDE